MKQLWEAADFIRNVHRRLRFGDLSRAPLKLLRLEVRGEEAECEWMARPADPWDADLQPGVGEQHASSQALEDGLAIRKLIFFGRTERKQGRVPRLSRSRNRTCGTHHHRDRDSRRSGLHECLFPCHASPLVWTEVLAGRRNIGAVPGRVVAAVRLEV